MDGYTGIFLVECMIYIYTFLKLQTDFNRTRLMTIMTLTNCFLFSHKMAVYVTILHMLVLHHIVFHRICSKTYHFFENTKIITYVSACAEKLNLSRIKTYILVMGDLISNMLVTLLVTLIHKLTNNSKIGGGDNIAHTEKEHLADYMMEDDSDKYSDEYLHKLDGDLDKLIDIGTTVISQTLAGHKATQQENATTFMTGFANIFGKKHHMN